jgi:hypothetical protein
MGFSRTELVGAKVYTLLHLEWAGLTIRLATEHLDIEEASTGNVYHYDGLLNDLQLADALELLAEPGEGRSLAVEVYLPVDVPTLVAQGHRLDGAWAEVSRWIEGTDYADRQRVIRGRVSDPEWGAEDEPVAFSIEDEVWQDAGQVLSSAARVDGTTWPEVTSLNVEHLGLPYPLVFGRPGALTRALGGSARVSGSQGVWVDYRGTAYSSGSHKTEITLVIAGHHVTAGRAYGYTDDATAGTRFVVLNGVDLKGQQIAFIPWYASAPAGEDPYEWDGTTGYQFAIPDFDGADSFGLGHASIDGSFNNATTQAPVFVSWDDEESADQGGLSGLAGDVLEYLLRLTHLPLDHGRFAVAKQALNAYKLGFTIDAQCSPWEWIKEHLLPLLPVSVVQGPDGLYPVLWRFDATASDATFHLDPDEDPRISRASRLKADNGGIYNDFSLAYALSIRTGNHAGLARLTAGPFDSDDPDTKPSLACKVSQQRYKNADGTPLISKLELTTDIVYDSATADMILAWQAAARCFGKVQVSYLVPGEWEWLERGQVGTLTDSEVGLSSRVVIVLDIQRSESGLIGLELLILESPGRDRKAS